MNTPAQNITTSAGRSGPALIAILALVAVAFSGCSGVGGADVSIVRLKHECQILPPKKSGGEYILTYPGLGVQISPAPKPLCRVPKGSPFVIEEFRVLREGGWTDTFAVGHVTCGKNTYPVQMSLYITENAGNPKAAQYEASKLDNRFWTRSETSP